MILKIKTHEDYLNEPPFKILFMIRVRCRIKLKTLGTINTFPSWLSSFWVFPLICWLIKVLANPLDSILRLLD